MKERGYSLIEVVTVLALCGIMAYIVAFSFNDAVPRFNLNKGAWDVVSMLNQARFRSVWAGLKCRVRVEGGALFLEAYDEDASEWTTLRRFDPAGVAVAANNWPIFHPQGTVSNLASISVSNAAGSFKITLAISGRIKSVRIT